MGVAIATCLVAYVNWDFVNRWDEGQLNADRIYRVQFWREFQGRSDRFGMAPMALAGHIRHNFPEVTHTVRYMSAYCDIRIGTEVFGTGMVFADSAYFDLFTYKLLSGAWKDFHNKGKVFISDRIALKYYNTVDAVGKPLSQIVLGKDGIRRPKEFEVGGVFEAQPTNSSFAGAEVITMFDNFWEINLEADLDENSWKRYAHVLFLEIPDKNQIAAVEQRLQQYIEPQNKAREDFKISRYFLENFKGMMRRNRAEPRLEAEYLRGGIPEQAVTVPNVMAALLLLLACFNFTNTSIAISGRRLKEIGIRKVMGSMRRQLISQFLGENLLLCFFGLMAGLLIAEFLVPAYDALWPWLDIRLTYADNIPFILFLAVLLLITALIAGGYPAFYVTSFEPVSILKGKTRFGGTNWFTRILLFGQFMISLLGIVMGVAFYNNGVYQRNYDLGFATFDVISAWVNHESGFNTYRDALASNKEILKIAGTRHHISNSFYQDPVKYESLEKEVDIMDIGDDYMEAMSMKLLEGRGFNRNSETDRKESVLVTEEFAKQFGWKDGAVGKRVVWMDTVQLFVVGVVRNVYTRALWEPVKPLMIRYVAPERYQQLVVQVAPGKTKEVDEFMRAKWKEVFPNAQYAGQRMDERMAEADEINRNLVTMLGFLGFFAALMTGIGLYTLVSLNILKRMKEIGVRKVLGASVLNIARVINLEFIISLGIATVAGASLGYLASDWLMDSIWEYYETLTPISLALSVLVMVVIALAAVSYKTVSTALLNPTRTLRDE